jgi:hypothetical protein
MQNKPLTVVLLKDADAAKKFFTNFKKETDEFEWYQRPTGPQCCKKWRRRSYVLVSPMWHRILP